MEVIQVGQHIQDAANLAEEVERPATDSATTHTLGTVAGDVMFLGCQVNQQNATLINARVSISTYFILVKLRSFSVGVVGEI